MRTNQEQAPQTGFFIGTCVLIQPVKIKKKKINKIKHKEKFQPSRVDVIGSGVKTARSRLNITNEEIDAQRKISFSKICRRCITMCDKEINMHKKKRVISIFLEGGGGGVTFLKNAYRLA